MEGLQAINTTAESMIWLAVHGPLNFVAAMLVSAADFGRDSITSAPTCDSMKLIYSGFTPYRLVISLDSRATSELLPPSR
jgi:hypothetical protein